MSRAMAERRPGRERRRALPGFGLSLGITLTYLSHAGAAAARGVMAHGGGSRAVTKLLRRCAPRRARPRRTCSRSCGLDRRRDRSTRSSGRSWRGCSCATVPGAAGARRAGRSPVRAADRGGGHRAHRALRQDRSGSGRRSSELGIEVGVTQPVGVAAGARVRGAPVRRAHRPAGARGRSTQRSRRPRPCSARRAGSDAVRRVVFPALRPCAIDRLRARVRTWRGRVRLGRLHRGQHADEDRDRPRCWS
jgi:hypothetical protein